MIPAPISAGEPCLPRGVQPAFSRKTVNSPACYSRCMIACKLVCSDTGSEEWTRRPRRRGGFSRAVRLPEAAVATRRRGPALSSPVPPALLQSARSNPGVVALGRLAAHLRSFFTLGLAGDLAAVDKKARTIDARLAKIEEDLVALRTIVRTRDDRAQQRLKAALASLTNVISILPELNVKGAVPTFPHQGFEITGEEAAFLFHLVRRHRPKLILELGSGSSTVLFAAALRANGAGRVISVEHDALHARHTAQLLEQAGLSDRVELMLAPLVGLADRGPHFPVVRPRAAPQDLGGEDRSPLRRRPAGQGAVAFAATRRCRCSCRIFRRARSSSSTTDRARTRRRWWRCGRRWSPSPSRRRRSISCRTRRCC